MAASGDDTIGVEEEFFLVDAATTALVPRGGEIVDAGGGQFEAEFHQALVENASDVCTDLVDLGRQLGDRRARLAQLAGERGLRIISAGTTPIADLGAQEVTDSPRFHRMLDDYQQLAREQLICGSQTHIGFADRDESIGVMNRVRPWLPVLLALSASSPYFAGADTGYASYRTQVWTRWPTSGMPAAFDSWEQYQEVTAGLVDSGAIADTAMLYWWLRPSQHVPTLEFRVADAATTVEEAVMLAGLSRAIADHARGEIRDGRPAELIRPEWLAVATWRAGRFGLDGELLDPVGGAAVAASELVRTLVGIVDAHLGTGAERDVVLGTLEAVMASGSSATRQRAAFQRRDRMEDVVEHLVAETAEGLPARP
ncbi:MAG: glutamate--cysteine ligase [Ilumatobacteraceae bacterium]